MLGPIRTYFFEKEKKKRLSRTPQRFPQFRKDRKNHYGILLDASLQEDRNEVMAFSEQLRKEGNRVKILGFFEGRPEGLTTPFDIYASGDLAKLSKAPRSPLVDAFIDQSFDVLINMSIRHYHPSLEYISTLSKASFRIGPWYSQQRQNPYDLSIDACSSATLREWINELMHTLQKIY